METAEKLHGTATEQAPRAELAERPSLDSMQGRLAALKAVREAGLDLEQTQRAIDFIRASAHEVPELDAETEDIFTALGIALQGGASEVPHTEAAKTPVNESAEEESGANGGLGQTRPAPAFGDVPEHTAPEDSKKTETPITAAPEAAHDNEALTFDAYKEQITATNRKVNAGFQSNPTALMGADGGSDYLSAWKEATALTAESSETDRERTLSKLNVAAEKVLGNAGDVSAQAESAQVEEVPSSIKEDQNETSSSVETAAAAETTVMQLDEDGNPVGGSDLTPTETGIEFEKPASEEGTNDNSVDSVESEETGKKIEISTTNLDTILKVMDEIPEFSDMDASQRTRAAQRLIARKQAETSPFSQAA